MCIQYLKENHTAEYLTSKLIDICDEYKVSNPTTTTDNGANIVKAMQINKWQRFPCFAHCLNLAVTSGFKLPEISRIIDVAKKLVSHFKHSPKMYQKLKQTAECLRDDDDAAIGYCTTLIQECPTRWNSCYNMLHRLVTLKPAIMATLTSAELTPSQSEWKLMDELAEVLLPLKVVYEKMCGQDYPTLSGIYPVLICLIKVHLKIDPANLICVKDFKKKIIAGIEAHFKQDTQWELIELSAYLDPRLV